MEEAQFTMPVDAVKIPAEVESKVKEPWEERLEDEILELHNRLRRLTAAFLNNELKMSWKEWNLLHNQYDIMQRYFGVLSERCQMYGLFIPDEKGC